MADFEGKFDIDEVKSSGEIKGKFKLSEEELDNVAGGCPEGGDADSSEDANADIANHEAALTTCYVNVEGYCNSNRCVVCGKTGQVVSGAGTNEKVVLCPTGYYTHFSLDYSVCSDWFALVSKTA